MSTLDRLAACFTDRYRLERELGAGGMATVYLAHDLRHDRKVALKVLKPELAAVIGGDRFLAEIRTTANLQHPHILPLFDSGQVSAARGEGPSFIYYAMPFVDGESLRDRLTREKQLPIADAIRIATEVADALHYAHGHHVIHRDIKPENILLHGGHALVADFGIALAASHTGGERMTETGMSLGTPTYMSPEQAMGERSLDARTDVYALGCVLYEMLVGDPPFTGSTAQAIVAKVLTERPSGLHARRDRVPPNVEDAILTALEKLPADRFASAAEFSSALTTERGDRPASIHRGRSATQAPLGSLNRATLGSFVALVVALAGLAAWGWLRTPNADPPLLQLETVFHDIIATDAPALSPDGRRIVYANVSGTALHLRDLADTSATTLATGDDYWTQFFSPDGNTVGYLTGFPGAIKLLTLAGGQTRTIVPSGVYANGATWSDDGWIYYPAGERAGTRLMRVRADGGTPELVATPDSTRNEGLFYLPRALPGGRRLLVTVCPVQGDLSVALLDVVSKTLTPLAKGVAAYYAEPGYLVVMQADGSIRAAEFDAGSGLVRSSFVTIVSGADPGAEIRPPFVVSPNGVMVHLTREPQSEFVRVTRDGRETPLIPGFHAYLSSFALAPDASRLAIAVNTGARTELWVKALPDGPFTRLVGGVNLTHRPDWSPDGRYVTFISDHTGSIATFRVPADGSRPPELLVRTNESVDESVISRDGQWLIYRQGSGTSRHLYAMRLGVDTIGRPLIPGSTAQEFSPTLSPDGRWLTYVSNESGRDEVQIRPFPETESAKYVVSRNGGQEPTWSRSGRELFFRTPAAELVVAQIASGATPSVSSLRVLFRTPSYVLDVKHRGFAVEPGDQSFVFMKNAALNAPKRAHLTTSVAALYRAKRGQ
jgi:serine/threonine-protein kinase